MSIARASIGLGLTVCALLTATGCYDPADRQQISSLQDQLRGAIADRDKALDDLNNCNNLTDRQRAEIAALRKRIEDLMAGGTPPPSGGLLNEAAGIAWADLAENILFDPGKAVLRPAGRQAIQQVLQEIQTKHPDREIWIIGHTDSDPIKHSGWKDNLELSVQRGAAVFRELQVLGVPPGRMVAAGCGEHRPKADNSTAAGKQQNRRVTIAAVQRPSTDRAPTPTAGGGTAPVPVEGTTGAPPTTPTGATPPPTTPTGTTPPAEPVVN